ncbi:GNAT family N-acetyltransferase [Micromonospora fluostatini]|uniref:GNAT family N-acetyltransferase n=1 Tax=Micromonospora sp. JCM 30529 TaxID=3421643 RepID=UPI003D174C5E
MSEESGAAIYVGVIYTRHDGSTAPVHFPKLVEMYARVYAEPPYEEGPEQVSRFASLLPNEAARPGFTLISAERNGVLIGAAYGLRMAAGQWWSSTEQEPPAHLLDADKFALMEWFVVPDEQGQGVGAGLMTRLLAGRPEPWAMLAADPRAPVREMYSRAGWRQVTRISAPWGPSMDVLVRALD